ncbi:hypothetical protein Taro_014332 [Colocasia esculenta]|uniref:Uncharacterized protein n=1 Tax=Colocasia esculenta TaxID=4460 RepID=A0A843UIJ6_COLES|nr:hypothetical protein [Colocasia esculenta]
MEHSSSGHPADVATAERVATSDKASPWSDVNLSRHGLAHCVQWPKAVPCVPALADGPSGGFRKGCRVCLCLLGLSWLQASGVVSVVVATPVLCSPGARHLRACPRDRLLPLLGTPIPALLCQRELLRATGVLELRTRSGRGKWWGSGVSRRSSVGPQFGRTAVVVFVVEVAYHAHPSVVSITRSLVPSVVALECVVSLTSWRVQGPGWFCLWALDLVEVEVAVSGVAPVIRELLCLGGCVLRVCFHIALLWPDPGCGSWHCSIPAALAGKGLVVGSMGGGTTFGGPWRGVREVASFPAGSECAATIAGCACFEHGCWFARATAGFVISLRIRVGVLPKFFSIGSGGGEVFPKNFVVLISGCCGVALWVEVHCLAAVFWWCFPGLFVVVLVTVPLPLGLLLCSLKSSVVLPLWLRSLLSGEGSSQDYSGLFIPVVVLPQERLLALWVEVLPKLPCVVFACRCSLSVEMSCRYFWLD